VLPCAANLPLAVNFLPALIFASSQSYYYNCWKLGATPLSALFYELRACIRGLDADSDACGGAPAATTSAAAHQRRPEPPCSAAACRGRFEEAAARALVAATVARELEEARAAAPAGAGGAAVGAAARLEDGGPRWEQRQRLVGAPLAPSTLLQGRQLGSGGASARMQLRGPPDAPPSAAAPWPPTPEAGAATAAAASAPEQGVGKWPRAEAGAPSTSSGAASASAFDGV
jgi:hypothetical protein